MREYRTIVAALAVMLAASLGCFLSSDEESPSTMSENNTTSNNVTTTPTATLPSNNDTPTVAPNNTTAPLPEPDMGPGGDMDSQGDMGMQTDDCDAQAEAYCSKLASCSTQQLIARYEDEATCVSERKAACDDSGTMLEGTNGVVDPQGCSEALIASCDVLLRPVPLPAACEVLPGDRAEDDSCSVDAQCDTSEFDGLEQRQYCGNGRNGPPILGCDNGRCFRYFREGAICDNPGVVPRCDIFGGQACLPPFDADTGIAPRERARCRVVQYGTNGDPCFPGTERQCATGFRCETDLKECRPVLQEDDICRVAADLCDDRLGLVCMRDDETRTELCKRSLLYVRVGAQCGMVDDEQRLCSAYAVCRGADPTTCELRRKRGETCINTPVDNCWPGLVCRDGSCQDPEPPDCPN